MKFKNVLYSQVLETGGITHHEGGHTGRAPRGGAQPSRKRTEKEGQRKGRGEREGPLASAVVRDQGGKLKQKS